MREKSKIILPDHGGVADLDIRRVLHELEEKPVECEMLGYMPEEVAKHCIEQLELLKEGIEQGKVSSLAVLAIIPGGIADAGMSLMNIAPDENDKIHSLFHVAFMQFEDEDSDGEAG
jgi:hypothetical protein